MLRVFLGTSVLFSAIYSPTGAARDLLYLAFEGKVVVVLSSDVLTEVERNILKKLPHLNSTYQTFMAKLEAESAADPSSEHVQQVAQYVVAKDAPIVAAAIQAKPDFFVTYDRKHLLEPVEVATRSGLVIVTPDVVVNRFKPSG